MFDVTQKKASRDLVARELRTTTLTERIAQTIRAHNDSFIQPTAAPAAPALTTTK